MSPEAVLECRMRHGVLERIIIKVGKRKSVEPVSGFFSAAHGQFSKITASNEVPVVRTWMSAPGLDFSVKSEEDLTKVKEAVGKLIAHSSLRTLNSYQKCGAKAGSSPANPLSAVFKQFIEDPHIDPTITNGASLFETACGEVCNDIQDFLEKETGKRHLEPDYLTPFGDLGLIHGEDSYFDLLCSHELMDKSSPEFATGEDLLFGPNSFSDEELLDLFNRENWSFLDFKPAILSGKRDSNHGFPFQSSKLGAKQIRTYLMMASDIVSGDMDPRIPYVMGTRKQEREKLPDGTYKERYRAIFGGPFGEGIATRTLTDPWLRALRSMTTYASAGGHHVVGPKVKEHLKLEADKLGYSSVDEMLSDCCILGADASGYDTSLRFGLSHDAFWDIFKSIFPTRELLINWLAEHYGKSGLVIPGHILLGVHGLYSGAMMTPTIGTLMGLILVKIWSKAFSKYVVLHLQQGDDNLTVLHDPNKELTFEMFVQVARKEMGIIIENDKRKNAFTASGDFNKDTFVPFIARLICFHSENELAYQLVLPPYRSFNSIFCPEDEDENVSLALLAGINPRVDYIALSDKDTKKMEEKIEKDGFIKSSLSVGGRIVDPTVALENRILASLQNLAGVPDLKTILGKILPHTPFGLSHVVALSDLKALQKGVHAHFDYEAEDDTVVIQIIKEWNSKYYGKYFPSEYKVYTTNQLNRMVKAAGLEQESEVEDLFSDEEKEVIPAKDLARIRRQENEGDA